MASLTHHAVNLTTTALEGLLHYAAVAANDGDGGGGGGGSHGDGHVTLSQEQQPGGGHQLTAQGGGSHGHGDEVPSISLASWKWDHVSSYIIITLFIVLSGLAKLIFHHTHFISSRVPESCLLIIVGIAFGAVLHVVDECQYTDLCGDQRTLRTFPEFTPQLFFYGLLPPIILEAAYSLHNRVFMENLRTILLYAVIGTIINFILIGGFLVLFYEVNWMGSSTVYERHVLGNHSDHEGLFPAMLTGSDETNMFTSMTKIQVFLFASLISAVDPVAVLAIFSEVGVNADLYFLVFGESLLNDGVAVVLYNMMSSFAGMEAAGMEITTEHIVIGIFSFFSIACGGLIIGFIFGLLTAFITKFTTDVRVVEPLATFGLAYLAYLVADLFNWSGILSLIGCGLLQAHYSFKNISNKSLTTVRYFIKMLSSASDCIIFLYLGMALLGDQVWHTGFVCWTLVLCLVVRFCGVFLQTVFVNILRHDIKVINYQEQFIMAYGGLRGAVGFSLVMMIDKSIVPSAGIFVTTTLAVVISTVFIQGGTIKSLVNLLHITKASLDEEPSLSEEINIKVFEHVMAGIEIISGKMGHFYWHEKLENLDNRFMKRWLCIPNYNRRMKKLFEGISLTDHLTNLYGPSLMLEDKTLHNFDNPAFAEGTPPVQSNGDHKKSIRSAAIPVTFAISGRDLSRKDRRAFSNALLNDPLKKFHQVYDKNILNDDSLDLEQVVAHRRQSAKKIRQKVLENRVLMERRKTMGTINQSEFPRDCFQYRSLNLKSPSQERSRLADARWRDSADSGRAMEVARLLEGLPSEDQGAVEAMLAGHQDLRRRKSLAMSIDSGRRDSYVSDKRTGSTLQIDEVEEETTDF